MRRENRLLPFRLCYISRREGHCQEVFAEISEKNWRGDLIVGADALGGPSRVIADMCQSPANLLGFPVCAGRVACARLLNFASGKRRAQATRPTADGYQLRIRRNALAFGDGSAGTSRTPSPTKHHPKRTSVGISSGFSITVSENRLRRYSYPSAAEAKSDKSCPDSDCHLNRRQTKLHRNKNPCL